MNIHDYNKIMVAGGFAAGKSWLAKHIALLTGYPLYHLDVEFWQPGWQKPPEEVFLARQKEIMSSSKWIIDGNYRVGRDLRWANADLIIHVDIGRFRRLISAARRHGKKRSDLPDYLHEDSWFSREFIGVIKMIWATHNKDRKMVFAMREKHADTAFLHIKSRRDMRRLLNEWRAVSEYS